MLNNKLHDYNKPDSSDEIDEIITAESNLEGYSDFYKDSEEEKVWWIDKIDVIGEILFSFDSENPFWRDFFSQ